jgi:hypothetical protein
LTSLYILSKTNKLGLINPTIPRNNPSISDFEDIPNVKHTIPAIIDHINKNIIHLLNTISNYITIIYDCLSKINIAK